MGQPEAPEVMVANPMRAELAKIRSSVASVRDTIAQSLDPASAKMGDGKTWTGPTAAKNWTAELNGRKKQLGPWVDAILKEIDSKLATMPEKVTATAARTANNDLAHRGY